MTFSTNNGFIQKITCGTINIVRVCVKASPAEGRRRLHTNTAYARLSGNNRLSCEASHKKETTIVRGNPCGDSEIPEWLQEFSENLVDDEIPLQGGSHANSSHEVSLEPTTKRREDLGKHSVYTHFPENRNCEICQRTNIARAPCRRRNGGAVPRAENFGHLITADHKVLSDNCESRNNHRYAVVVAGLGHPMDPVVSV